jgi:hypothetical protein
MSLQGVFRCAHKPSRVEIMGLQTAQEPSIPGIDLFSARDISAMTKKDIIG